MTYHVHKQGSILGLEERLDEIVQFVVDNFIPAGYGGITLSQPDATFPDLGAGWVELVADQLSIDPPRAITPDLAQNSLAFDVKGVWSISFGFTIDHDSSNGGRTINLRFFDKTDNDARGSLPIGIGRNVEVTSQFLTVFLDIAEDDIGHPFSIEVGGGDTVVIDSLDTFIYNAQYVSEFQGELP